MRIFASTLEPGRCDQARKLVFAEVLAIEKYIESVQPYSNTLQLLFL